MSPGRPLRADLLSDTLTRPTPECAPRWPLRRSGTTSSGRTRPYASWKTRVARLLGHEGGLFTPTGSMANQLALRLHVRPGEELVSDELAHVVRAELGAAAVFSGITSRTWSAPRGLLDPRQPMELAVTGAGPYQVCTALVVVENTHNFGGGTVQPIEAIRAAARRRPEARASGCTWTVRGCGTRMSRAGSRLPTTASCSTPCRCA